MRYNPMVAFERYSAATEDDRTMRWTEATHRADEHGNHNGVARSTPPINAASDRVQRGVRDGAEFSINTRSG
ncbi:hypothetical protein Pla52nx_005943 [Stieleria varia]|uniref:hypothetical protein n=1 Tax=Stieleria varia TaxID=2528005 RepID=UPI00313AF19C